MKNERIFRSRAVWEITRNCIAVLCAALLVPGEVSLLAQSQQATGASQQAAAKTVTPEQIAGAKEYLIRAVEASIHIGLVALLLGVCLVILRPFLPLIAWGVIVSISVYPESRVTTRRRPG
jgi:hypothetical protein